MSQHSIGFVRAKLAEKSGKLTHAKYLYLRPSVMRSQDRAEALYRVGNIDFQLGDYAEARRNIESALGLEDRASWHYRLGTLFEREQSLLKAQDEYRLAVKQEPANAKWRERLLSVENSLRMVTAKAADTESKALRKAGVRWQEIEVMRSASASFSKRPDWHIRLGEALAAMDRFAESADAYARANELKPNDSMILFKEGRCRARAGQHVLASARFADAIEADQSLESKRVGIGAFYQHLGDWAGAADAYAESVTAAPHDPELHFRAGNANERCYRWGTAEYYYESATALDPSNASWHFRRGYIQERQQKWVQASECYSFGLGLSSENAGRYWYYRLGFVLQEAGEFAASVEAYLKSHHEPNLAQDTRPEHLLEPYAVKLMESRRNLARSNHSFELNMQVARECEVHGLWSYAAEHLLAAADQCEKHTPGIYYRLGRAHYLAGLIEEAATALRMTKLVTKPRGIDASRYAKDLGLGKLFEYSEMCENLPLRDHVILYESFMGSKIGCNPYALYLELSSRPEFEGYLHVWTITSATYVPLEMRERNDVVLVTRGSHAYRRYLATAKHLINNVTFESYFVRREGQKYLNTWHGTPMKSLGRDIKTGFLEHRNVTRNFLQTTHMLSANRHTTEVLTHRYDVASLLSGSIAETGYPRVDRTLNMTETQRHGIRQQLGATDKTKKVVLYAPTWRGDLKNSHFDVEKLISDLEALSALDCHVIFQAHHHTEKLLPNDLGVTIVPKSIETNDLLAVVDVLITDYSSILFDFIPTGRPVLCYVYDLEEYSSERGLYFTPAELGLPQIEDVQTLKREVSRSLDSVSDESRENPLIGDYTRLEDGQSASRAISYFFDDADVDVVQMTAKSKQRLLFHHSFLPNGITASLVNLISSLDHEFYDVTVVVPVAEIEKDEIRQTKLWELPEAVHVIGQFGRHVVNIEEKWIIDYFNRHKHFESSEQETVYNGAFTREFRRIFGDSVFDSVIEFEGYSRFWSSVLSQAPGTDTRKFVYMHNDMHAEWRSKYGYLEAMFRLYGRFDAYVSVSPALAVENRRKLTDLFSLEKPKFVHAINQIDSTKVLELAAETIDRDLEPWFAGGVPTLLSMGRMSPEKDQKKLIDAIADLNERGLETRLVIFGSGPLESLLRDQIAELGLEDLVFLAGQRSNPFPALSLCSAFVLASNHEGQPMVLLEALVLGKHVIATDITGSRFVLEGTSGRLVENSVQGLVGGIADFLSGNETDITPFDADLYQKKAAEAFLELVSPNDSRKEPK